MSFPEWGLGAGDDDTAYVNGIVEMFNADNFAFQCYFDEGDDGIAQLGPSIPNSVIAYHAFQ